LIPGDRSVSAHFSSANDEFHFLALRHSQNTPPKPTPKVYTACRVAYPLLVLQRVLGLLFRVAFLELAGGAEIGSETTLGAAPLVHKESGSDFIFIQFGSHLAAIWQP
jgi:hypothetical protein